MKRAAFKLDASKRGWIRTTIAPLNDKAECKFGMVDICLLSGVVVAVVAIARVLLAH
jgi:hypothetical protein